MSEVLHFISFTLGWKAQIGVCHISLCTENTVWESFGMDLFFLFLPKCKLKGFVKIWPQINVYILRSYYKKCFEKSYLVVAVQNYCLWKWLFPESYFCLNGVHIFFQVLWETKSWEKKLHLKRIKYILNDSNHFNDSLLFGYTK